MGSARWGERRGARRRALRGVPTAGPGAVPATPRGARAAGCRRWARSASWVPSRPRGWGRGRGTEQSLGAGGRKPVAAETRAVRVGFSEPFRRIHRRVLLQTGSSRQSQRAPEMSRLVTFLLESRSAGQEVPPPLLRKHKRTALHCCPTHPRVHQAKRCIRGKQVPYIFYSISFKS